MPQKHLSRTAASHQLGVAPRTISNYIARGWISAVRIGRRFVIDAISVERLLLTGSCPCGTKRTSATKDKGPTCALKDTRHD